MGNSFCFSWEVPFLQWMQSAESPLVNALAKCITLFGEEYFLILVVGLCFWCIDKRLGRNVALGVSGSILFGCLIQGVVRRRRPYMDHPEIKCLKAPHADGDTMSVVAQGYSLPSLHTTLCAGGYGTLALNIKKKMITCAAIALPVLVGISRLYLGVHYPTDILCGLVLGVAVMLLFSFVEGKYGYKAGFLLQLMIGAIGFFYCRDNGFYSIYGVIVGLFFGFWYEEKRVHFKMCQKWYGYVLRTLLGVLVFVLVSAVLKLPVRNLSEDEHIAFQFCYRAIRYALATFVTMGVYPHLFQRIRFLS